MDLKELMQRTKIVERLYTLYDLKQILQEKIKKAEQELSQLDMEKKNEHDKTTKA